MKRFIVLTMLVMMALSSTGCRRGFRMWGFRGARCGSPMAPSFTPSPQMPTYAPTQPGYAPVQPGYAPVQPSYQAAPMHSAPPCDPCPPASYSGCYDTVPGGSSAMMPITDDSIGGASYRAPSIETVPYSGANYKSLPGAISVTSNGKNQYMGHIIGDRKLEPGETIQREYTLPLESAAATKADKK